MNSHYNSERAVYNRWCVAVLFALGKEEEHGRSKESEYREFQEKDR